MATLIDTNGWRRRYTNAAQGWPNNSRSGITFVRTGKAQYRCRITGEGRSLVFVADPPVTIEAYDGLFAVLSEHFRCVVIEAAAMGFSAANTSFGFAFEETNDDLALVLRQIAGEGAILAFSCVGGLAAVDIAVRYPELVAGLFLLQTTDVAGFLAWKRDRDPKGLLRKPFLGQIGMKRLARDRAPRWFEFAVGRQDAIAPLCRCAEQGFAQGMQFSLASIFQRYLVENIQLGTPSQPLSVVWGARDRSHDEKSLLRVGNLAPHAEIIVREDLGHFAELENPEVIKGLLLSFNEKLASSNSVSARR